MSRTTPPLRSFSSGEIDPLLAARTDYQRFQTGLSRCNGFLPLIQGGVTRAPGTIYRGRVKDDATAILVPFVFAVNDACVLEFTNLKMRVWRYGALVLVAGLPYEVTTPYSTSDLSRLRWQQTADVVYLTDGVHPPHTLSRTALDNWTLAPAAFNSGPFRSENSDTTLTVTLSAATGTVSLTASAAIFLPEHAGGLFWVTPADLKDVPQWVGNETAAVNSFRRLDNKIYKLTQRTPANVGPNPPLHDRGEVAVMEGVKWLYVSDLDGILRIDTVTDSTHASGTVLRQIPQEAVTNASYRWAFGAWSDAYGYPRTVQLYDARLVFAATDAEPRTIWFSTAADYSDFFAGAAADQSFSFTVAGDGSINRILNLKAGRSGLHVLALGQEFSTRSESRAQVIGPTNAVFGLDSAVGSADTQAIAPFGSPIFIARDRIRLVQLAYDLQTDGNQITVLSRPSQHLGNLSFRELEWTASPQPMAWIRREGGDLAVMVYDPGEDVLGWSTISLAGGKVESMAVVPDPVTNVDVMTVVVNRTLNGSAVRTVEEFAPWYGVLTGDLGARRAQHLYCASTFVLSPSAASTFSVPHLVGETVMVWTGFGNMGPFVVPPSGDITLDRVVQVAHIGLFDDTHFFQTLDIQAPVPDGAAQGRRKRLAHKQAITLHRTVQGRVQAISRSPELGEQAGTILDLIRVDVAAEANVAVSGVRTVDLQTPLVAEAWLKFTPVGGAPMTVTAVTPKVQEEGA